MVGYRGRPIVVLLFSDDERRYLERQVRRHLRWSHIVGQFSSFVKVYSEV
jgi:hypothetical protein